MPVRAESRNAEVVQGKFMGHPVVLLDVLYSEVTQTEKVCGFVPDANWRASDRVGHKHRAELVNGTVKYPTLRLNVSEPGWCADCQDTHEDRWYSCRWCGENITPGTRYDEQTVVVDTTHTIDLTMLWTDFHRHAAVDGAIVVKHDTSWDVEADGRTWRCVLNEVYTSPDDTTVKMNGRLA